MMNIVISKNNQQFGPYDEDRVREMISQGHLSLSDWAFRQGDSEWRKLGEMLGDADRQRPGDWTASALSSPFVIENKSKISTLAGYLIALLIFGLAPVIAGLVFRFLLKNQVAGEALMFVGLILFVTLGFLFGLIFLIQLFGFRKNAATLDRDGTTLINGTRYVWNDLKHINFVEFRNSGVHGQGLIVLALSKVAIALFRRASERDSRARNLARIEFVFNAGKATVPVNVRNISGLFDLVERIPAPWCVDDSPDEAKIQALGFTRRVPGQAAAAIENIASAPAPKRSGFGLLVGVGVAAALLLVVGIGGGAAILYFKPTRSTISNTGSGSNSSTPTPVAGNDRKMTYPDPQPDKRPDITISAVEFESQTEGLSIEKQKSTWGGKIIELTGRAYMLYDTVTDNTVYLHAPTSSVKVKIVPAEISKLSGLKASESLRFKCRSNVDYMISLVDCVLLERKPPIVLSEPADFTVTAVEFWKATGAPGLSYATAKRNRAKYFGKVIEIEGEVFEIGTERHFLKTGENQWVTCYPNDDDTKQFEKLVGGSRVKFRAIDDGNALRHCVVASS